ncbi:hypothetical protein [Desulfonatronum thioautotrophicum]|uniref:hypothetical protein n=1 Tax=Desulfonatronum thioautotrophicum TaxID=617001 RepID=UPI0005EB981E|nr:hypothetical protein [Desulfonatronum thioautotrophicum]
MHGPLIRTICTVLAVGVLFAGVFFAQSGYRKQTLAQAALDRVQLELVEVERQRDALETAQRRLDRAGMVLSGLGPVPGAWTSFPLVTRAVLDTEQTGRILALLGRREDWTILRTESLTLRPECGLEPCERFFVDLRAVVFAPVPVWGKTQEGP